MRRIAQIILVGLGISTGIACKSIAKKGDAQTMDAPATSLTLVTGKEAKRFYFQPGKDHLQMLLDYQPPVGVGQAVLRSCLEPITEDFPVGEVQCLTEVVWDNVAEGRKIVKTSKVKDTDVLRAGQVDQTCSMSAAGFIVAPAKQPVAFKSPCDAYLAIFYSFDPPVEFNLAP